MNSHVKKVLILGSGALQIGQAGEFDYSGSQAIKALKEEGIKTILINPNIATIQTSQGFADKVYLLPITLHFVEEIIKREKPDSILLSFGGQTALNCGLELKKLGVLKKYNVTVLGTPITAIQKTEDRRIFAEFLESLNLKTPKNSAIEKLSQINSAAKKIGFPVIARGAFTLGGQDSKLCTNIDELREAVEQILRHSPQVLIEKYLTHWKEIEYEVVRDKYDNCITVCNMENLDPMGIHTGESIVVAPSQTLNNFEYHTLREIAIKVIRQLGVVGECNIQFALNPDPGKSTTSSKGITGITSFNQTRGTRDTLNSRDTLDYRIIEVNARLSRSSALASKATGYPLAYVAAKLALGQNLTEIKNSVTKKTIACFEPSLDYCVVKIPRWDLNKFVGSKNNIGSSMQSVGEVMAIGRRFEEAIQKAVRMLDLGIEGLLDEKISEIDYAKPTPWRIFALSQKLKINTPVSEIYKNTGIDPFFLEKIKIIASFEKSIAKQKKLEYETIKEAKRLGFSDKRIAKLTKTTQEKILAFRNKFDIHPVVKQIDTLSAEYPAETNYLYLTYNGESDDINLKPEIQNRKIVVLGSGPYRVGSSVEFDWCSVTCAQTLKKNGFSPIIVNCNPETVSTDYDMADKLYFEELTLETIMEIYQKENPKGIIVSMGGQTPNNLVVDLAQEKTTILGTSTKSIDKAEDRNKFSKLCDELGIHQPPWINARNTKEALAFSDKVSLPVLVRPSYVLSGMAFNIAFNKNELINYLNTASLISSVHPIVISKFIENAKEIEIDAVAKNGKILVHAISEHVENAGVHSGDATLILPAQKIYLETKKQIVEISAKIAANLKITGPFNIQFLAKDNQVMVIECNLRSSRSLPFVSKVTGVNFVEVATKAILNLNQPSYYDSNNISYVGVKAPQFSFSKILGADPILRIEMASTGEVATFGQDVYEAFLKSIMATGMKLPTKSVFISLGGDENKIKFLESARALERFGLKIYATSGTSKFLKDHEIKNQKLYKIHENKKPTVIDFIVAKKIDLVINIFVPYQENDLGDGYLIRRATIDFAIPLLTNLQTAELFAKALSRKTISDLKPLPWNSYVAFRG